MNILSRKKSYGFVLLILAISTSLMGESTAVKLAGNATKALFDKNNKLYLLHNNDLFISIYSNKGHLLNNFDVGTIKGIYKASQLQDIALDDNGDLLCLAFGSHSKMSSYIIHVNQSTGRADTIEPSLPLSAWRMDKDSKGNLYLLGFEQNTVMALGKTKMSTANILFKFTKGGKFQGSYLPMDVSKTQSQSEFTTLFSSLVAPSNFLVLPNGEIWFLETKINTNQPPWNNPVTLHHVDTNGRASIENVKSIKNSFLLGIHKYLDEIVFEWANRGAVQQKILSKQDGTQIGVVEEGGRIIGIRNGVAITKSGQPSSPPLLVPIKNPPSPGNSKHSI